LTKVKNNAKKFQPSILTWNQELEDTEHNAHRENIVAQNWLILPHISPGKHTELKQES
jgi:hypothetical protein